LCFVEQVAFFKKRKKKEEDGNVEEQKAKNPQNRKSVTQMFEAGT